MFGVTELFSPILSQGLHSRPFITRFTYRPLEREISTRTFADDDTDPVTASHNLLERLKKNRWKIKVIRSKSSKLTFTLKKRTLPFNLARSRGKFLK